MKKIWFQSPKEDNNIMPQNPPDVNLFAKTPGSVIAAGVMQE